MLGKHGHSDSAIRRDPLGEHRVGARQRLGPHRHARGLELREIAQPRLSRLNRQVRLTTQDLVKERTQRKHIAACIGMRGAERRLFGTRVGKRPEEQPVRREIARWFVVGVTALGDAEVDHLRGRVGIAMSDEHIARLEVAVDDPFGVRMGDPSAHFEEEHDALRQRQLRAIAVLRDRQSLDERHREPRLAVIGRARIDDPLDVRVVHAREHLPLEVEAFAKVLRGKSRTHHLDGDEATDRMLLHASVDDSGAPLRDHRLDAKWTDESIVVGSITARISRQIVHRPCASACGVHEGPPRHRGNR